MSAQDGCRVQNPKGKSQVVVEAWSEDRDLLRVSDAQADKSKCQEQRASQVAQWSRIHLPEKASGRELGMEAESRLRVRLRQLWGWGVSLGWHKSTGTLLADSLELLTWICFLLGSVSSVPPGPACASSCQSPESGKDRFLTTPDVSPVSDSLTGPWLSRLPFLILTFSTCEIG